MREVWRLFDSDSRWPEVAMLECIPMYREDLASIHDPGYSAGAAHAATVIGQMLRATRASYIARNPVAFQ